MYWQKLWRGISSASWPTLIALQKSFASKAVLILAIVAFTVGTLAPDLVEKYVVKNWRIHCLFWGAVLFLFGQLVLSVRRPIEFARTASTEDAIKDISLLSTQNTFESRCDMLTKIVGRYEKECPAALNQVEVDTAKRRVADSRADPQNWKINLPLVVTSQRRLIAFDRERSRVLVVMLLATGVSLMLFPTGMNVLVTALKLTSVYWHWAVQAACSIS